MKKRKQLIWITIFSMFLFTACEKTEEFSINSILGTYSGTYKPENGTKNLSFNLLNAEATAEITDIGNGQIQVYCYGSEVDTTFTLNYFEHNDSVLICINGSDFENRYGHMLGTGHMSGGMMNDILDGETEWAHHMNDEHQVGDEHFGGFDMSNHTFSYTFEMTDGDYHFQGKKK